MSLRASGIGGSATPLAWSHAQLVRLAWSIEAGAPVEQPSIVACRYVRPCP
jgi:glucoamylase